MRLHDLLLLLLLPREIRPPARHRIHHTQPHRRPAHQASGPKPLPQNMFPSPRQHEVCGRPGAREARAVPREPLHVEITGEQQNRWEEHGNRLEGSQVLGGDERCEDGGWERVFWAGWDCQYRILMEIGLLNLIYLPMLWHIGKDLASLPPARMELSMALAF